MILQENLGLLVSMTAFLETHYWVMVHPKIRFGSSCLGSRANPQVRRSVVQLWYCRERRSRCDGCQLLWGLLLSFCWISEQEGTTTWYSNRTRWQWKVLHSEYGTQCLYIHRERKRAQSKLITGCLQTDSSESRKPKLRVSSFLLLDIIYLP